MAEPNIPSNSPAVKDDELRVAGPGRYRLRNGNHETLIPAYDGKTKLRGQNHGYIYSVGGNGMVSFLPHPFDIVAGPIADAVVDQEPKMFRVRGPGRYETRGRGIAVVLHKSEFIDPYVWTGIDGIGDQATWTVDGRYDIRGGGRLNEHSLDLIAGPLPEESSQTESAGLTGFMVVYPEEGETTGIYDNYDTLRMRGGVHIDLSKVPASAIVKSEQKHFDLWLNIYRGGHNTGFLHEDRETADRVATTDRIACIKVEFTPGEGLD